jgi:hypothetical protein
VRGERGVETGARVVENRDGREETHKETVRRGAATTVLPFVRVGGARSRSHAEISISISISLLVDVELKIFIFSFLLSTKGSVCPDSGQSKRSVQLRCRVGVLY